MARLSFKEAVEWIIKKGYEFGDVISSDNKYYVKRDGEEILFKSGRELVSWVKLQVESEFDRDAANKKLEFLKSEVKRYEALAESTENKVMRDSYCRERYKLEKKVEEQEVFIKAEGNLLTGNRITNILKKAGYEVVVTHTTAVKGWHEYFGDFKITFGCNCEFLSVTVNHSRYCGEKVRLVKAKKMAKVVEDAGYRVVNLSDSGFDVDRIINRKGE